MKKAIDEFNHFIPGTTKTIKAKKPAPPEPSDLDDNSTRHHVGTKVYKKFDDIEYQGEVKGYDPTTRFYHIYV